VDWIHPAQDWDHWRALVKKVMNLRFHKILGNSLVTERLLTSEERLSFTELVILREDCRFVQIVDEGSCVSCAHILEMRTVHIGNQSGRLNEHHFAYLGTEERTLKLLLKK
jgi:hypothetical protein